MNKRNILLTFCSLLALSVSAQKITLGSCKMKDGGEYKEFKERYIQKLF